MRIHANHVVDHAQIETQFIRAMFAEVNYIVDERARAFRKRNRVHFLFVRLRRRRRRRRIRSSCFLHATTTTASFVARARCADIKERMRVDRARRAYAVPFNILHVDVDPF